MLDRFQNPAQFCFSERQPLVPDPYKPFERVDIFWELDPRKVRKERVVPSLPERAETHFPTNKLPPPA